MARAAEAQLDAVGGRMPSRSRRSPTPVSFSTSTVPVLEHAGAHAVLDVLARARLQHDRLDAGALEQVREQQPRGPGADDPHLRLHHAPFFAIVRARAAGRPGTSSAA